MKLQQTALVLFRKYWGTGACERRDLDVKYGNKKKRKSVDFEF